MKLSVLENLEKLDLNNARNVYVQSMLIDLSVKASKPSLSMSAYLKLVFRCGFDLLVLYLLLAHTLFILIIAILLKRNIAHYLIFVNPINKSNFDHRSEEMVSILNDEKYINFYHCSSPFKYLVNIYKLPLFSIYYKSLLPSSYIKVLERLLKPSLKDTVLKRYQAQGPVDVFIFRLVLKFLNLKMFVCLDDPRHTALIRLSCTSLKIPTFGYMHGRFNEFHIGLCGNPFNYYSVWSNYFKDKYLKMTGSNTSTIFYVGDNLQPGHAKKTRDISKLNILFVDDDLTPLEILIPYITVLGNSERYRIFVRNKNKVNYSLKNVQTDVVRSFQHSLVVNEIDVVVGGISTCLIESAKEHCLPISVQHGQDYGLHLITDFLCVPVYCEQELKNLLDGLSCADFDQKVSKIQSIHLCSDPVKLAGAWRKTLGTI